MPIPLAFLLLILLIATVVALPKWGFTATAAGYYPAVLFFIAFIVLVILWATHVL